MNDELIGNSLIIHFFKDKQSFQNEIKSEL
jgi:hypothetical protein